MKIQSIPAPLSLGVVTLKNVRRLALFVTLAAASSGCQLGQWVRNGFKVGPEYKTPDAPVAGEWMDYHAAPAEPANAADHTQWWKVFNDPVLDSLIYEAYKDNISLRAAGERIAEARAGRNFAVGELFPQTQNVSGGQSVNKISDRSPLFTGNQWFQNVGTSLNVGWEIDFWGRYRRALESANADLEASLADYDDVRVLLMSEVASSYVDYRTFQLRLALAKKNAETQRQSFELARNKFQGGASTERDMQQARQIYEQTLASVPQFELGVRPENSNALCCACWESRSRTLQRGWEKPARYRRLRPKFFWGFRRTFCGAGPMCVARSARPPGRAPRWAWPSLICILISRLAARSA